MSAKNWILSASLLLTLIGGPAQAGFTHASRQKIAALTSEYAGVSRNGSVSHANIMGAREKLITYLKDTNLRPSTDTTQAMRTLIKKARGESGENSDLKLLETAIHSAPRIIKGKRNVIAFLHELYADSSHFPTQKLARKQLMYILKHTKPGRTPESETTLRALLRSAQEAKDKKLIARIEALLPPRPRE
jgi:hypothetical protein